MWNDPGGDYSESAYAGLSSRPVNTQTVTTKIPPALDGRSSRFAYEEAIDDWCDITELDANKRGPALRNRLEGDAAVYKSLLDRELLRSRKRRSIFQKRIET